MGSARRKSDVVNGLGSDQKLPEDILVRAGFAQSSAGINFVDGNDPKSSLHKFPRMRVKEMLS